MLTSDWKILRDNTSVDFEAFGIESVADLMGRGERGLSSKALKELHRDMVADLRQMAEKVESEDRAYTEEEKELFGALQRACETVHLRFQDAESQFRNPDGAPVPGPGWLEGSQRTGSPDVQEWRCADGRTIEVLTSRANLERHIRQKHGLTDRDERVSIGKVIARSIGNNHVDLNEAEDRALAGTGASGQFLIEPQTAAGIIELARAQSVLLNYAKTVPMDTSEVKLVKATSDVSWGTYGENDEISASTPALGSLSLVARKVAVRVPISIELAQDAPNAPEVIEGILSRSLAEEIDRLGFLGDGSTEPRGIFSHSDVTSQTTFGSPTTWDEILDGMATVQDNGAPEDLQLVWSPNIRKTYNKLLVNSETNHYADPPAQVRDNLERRVTTQLGDTRMALGDLSQVLFGARYDMVQLERSNSGGSDSSDSADAWAKDQIEIKARMRLDFGIAHPTWLQAITGVSV